MDDVAILYGTYCQSIFILCSPPTNKDFPRHLNDHFQTDVVAVITAT